MAKAKHYTAWALLVVLLFSQAFMLPLSFGRNGRLSASSGDVTVIENNITTIQNDITTIENNITNIQNDITNIETALVIDGNNVEIGKGNKVTINVYNDSVDVNGPMVLKSVAAVGYDPNFGDTDGTDQIDIGAGNHWTVILTGDHTIDLKSPTDPNVLVVLGSIKVYQDGTGSHTLAWSADTGTIEWADDTEPTWGTTASSWNIVYFRWDALDDVFSMSANTGFNP